MKGWVYVISNPSMPNIVKIGYSLKDPILRAQELDNTGVPYPFDVDYSVLVDEPRDLEQRVHERLKGINAGKEWFKCSPESAATTIKNEYHGKIYTEESKFKPTTTAGVRCRFCGRDSILDSRISRSEHICPSCRKQGGF